MGLPTLLSENLFSTTQFPDHVIYADQESVGHEAWHVSDGRRSQFDYWTPTTTNAAHYVATDCVGTFAPTCLALDRGHNLAGKSLILSGAASSDFLTSNTDVISVTIPATVGSAASIDGANGVLTEEGAWIKRFAAPTAKRYWRVYIPAMGVGLVPVIVGVTLGNDYQPGYFFNPWDEDQGDLATTESVTEWGWRGRGPAVSLRSGAFSIKLANTGDYANARYHIVRRFGVGRPMWICYDDAQTERTFLAIRPAGSHLSIGYDAGWFPRQARVDYVEHEPLRP